MRFFQKKGKKGQNIWKFGQKCTKFENILKRAGNRTIIARNKRLIKYKITIIIANVQNICNLIGREEYNIGRIVLYFNIVIFD